MTTSLVVVALTVTGLMVGVELCVAALVNPIFDRLPGDAGLLARADGGRDFGRLMPWWYAASLALSVSLAVTMRDSAWAWITVTAPALRVLSVVMSVVLLVPIIDRVKAWTPGQVPHDWRGQLRRWGRLHYVRVAVIVTAFACLAIGGAAPMSS